MIVIGENNALFMLWNLKHDLKNGHHDLQSLKNFT